MRIFQVNQVRVIKYSDSPLKLVVQAQGMAASSGWTNPRLDNSRDPNPADAVIELNFDADRPNDNVLPVLTPIAASITLNLENGADAVIVSARINSITVHASQFICMPSGGQITTLAIGEEGQPTTLAVGEEGPPATTLAIGEEGQPTTLALGEENGPTTLAIGEEGQPTTLAVGEEGGPITNPLAENSPSGPSGGPFGTF